MAPIFLNYRRRACRDKAFIIHQLLESSLGEGSTFLDEESIDPGTKWPEALRQAVRECQVLLVLIHPDWHKDQEESGAKSLDQEGDWVRQEIAMALELGKVVIPVLLDGAYAAPLPKDPQRIAPPRPEWLPTPLRSLFDHEALAIDSTNLTKQHRAAFVAAIQKQLPPSIQVLQAEEPGDTYTQLLQASLPLPDHSYQDLCFLEKPYPGIAYFDENSAALFFGRDQEIWQVYYDHLLKLVPGEVLLLFGASGVGKSSLLNGGLFPRLKAKGWAVAYDRRQKALPLADLLDQLIAEVQAQPGSPKLVLLDQVEEIITDPGRPGEFEGFFDRLRALGKVDLKVVLGFRKEYLYEIRKALVDRRIWKKEFALHELDATGIERAIRGVFDTPRVREQFPDLVGATLDPNLVSTLVADISRDEKSHIAPLLQYQLESLYRKAREKAQASGQPLHLDLATYHAQAATSLASFLEAEKLKALERAFPTEMRNGLIDDILYYFSTPELTAATHPKVDLWARYAHLSGDPQFGRLIQSLVDQYLLLHDKPEGLPETYRLAHDALARIVRQRYENSDKPGQQAAFIVRAKEKIPLDKVGFSETDIDIIKEGRKGMYQVPASLYGKLQADARKYDRQRRDRLRLALRSAAEDIEHLRWTQALDRLRIAATEGIQPARILALVRYLPYPLELLGEKQAYQESLAFIEEIAQRMVSEGDIASEGFKPLAGHGWQARQQLAFFPEMKPVSGGSFQMGSEEMKRYLRNEMPVHKVTVNSFQMAATPVTCWQYGLYCQDTGKALPGDSGFGRGQRPVVNVSWYDALHYCNWLSVQQGLQPVYTFASEKQVEADWTADGYRLPTEAEWEYAARAAVSPSGGAQGGGNVRFGNGQDVISPASVNYNGQHEQNAYDQTIRSWNEDGVFRQRTTPVRRFAPNPLGLYDLSGNVFEWCWDVYDEDYYANSPKDNPRGPAQDPNKNRVIRGGSWLETALNCRSCVRHGYYPILQFNGAGFRVIRRLTL